ncbi:hypothetical protein NYR54_15095 [Chelativorans sp. SCAU2101]|jgi:hypothetical protein|uniref:Uncharacterized protein n=1 Tax=Chelativorans petroleitrophicus TaxID=2975484 RepID=A0A9X2XA59_9HYPH|nr:hypothetical protein [Chelativorans petroleitrophicus]MCT8991603.1 hypothetical protein [Chelativorans petroleitrophicus]
MAISVSRLANVMRLLPRVAILAMAMWLPLMAMDGVRAGSDNIIVDNQRMSSGAGLVLMVSLQRAR